MLDFTEEMVRTAQAAAIDPSAYPDHVEAGGLTLPLSYAFEPGRHDDGITVDVPVAALHQVDPTPFTWQVPGLREELVTALIKTLPKTLRRHFAPAPDHARAPCSPGWTAASRAAARRPGARAGPDARRRRSPATPGSSTGCPSTSPSRSGWSTSAAAEVARGTDLEALRRELAPQVARGAGRRGATSTQTGLTTWTIGDAAARASGCGGAATSSPATRAWSTGATTVDVRVFPTAAERDAAHAGAASARLLLLDTPSPARQVQRGLDNAEPTSCSPATRTARVAALVDDCVTRRRRRTDHTRRAAPPGTSAATPGSASSSPKRLAGTTQQVLQAVRGVLTVWHRVQAALADLRAPAPRDLAAQLDALVGPGFATRRGAPGSPTSPATWRRPSGGSRSCASTRPATRRGPRRSRVVADEYAAELWPRSRRAPNRRRSCARSAG